MFIHNGVITVPANTNINKYTWRQGYMEQVKGHASKKKLKNIVLG